MLLIAAALLIYLCLWLFFRGAAPLIQHALRMAAHRTAAFRYRDYAPVAILLIGGLVGTIVIGDEFLDLAEALQAESGELQQADAGVHQWAVSQRGPAATLFFTTFTLLGSPVGLTVMVAIVSALLLYKGRYRWLLYLLVTTGVGSLLVVQMKLYFSRARPDMAAALREAQGYSFPSGHAMGSTVVTGALAYLALRILPSWRAKAAALAGACTFVCAVSFSRIYLGVHWISDVGAGIAAGLVWVGATTVAYEAFRRIRLVRALRMRR